MPPQRVIVERAGASSRQRAPKGFVRSTFDGLTSADNRAMVTGITAFGVAVTFLSSTWAEWLLVPQ